MTDVLEIPAYAFDVKGRLSRDVVTEILEFIPPRTAHLRERRKVQNPR